MCFFFQLDCVSIPTRGGFCLEFSEAVGPTIGLGFLDPDISFADRWQSRSKGKCFPKKHIQLYKSFSKLDGKPKKSHLPGGCILRLSFSTLCTGKLRDSRFFSRCYFTDVCHGHGNREEKTASIFWPKVIWALQQWMQWNYWALQRSGVTMFYRFFLGCVGYIDCWCFFLFFCGTCSFVACFFFSWLLFCL